MSLTRTRPTVQGLLRDAGVPLGIYMLSRVLQLALLQAMLHTDAGGVGRELGSWDGKWYVRIVDSWYPQALTIKNGLVAQSAHAFFPLYPLTVRMVKALLPLPTIGAALLVSFLAGAAAAVLLHLVFARLSSRRAGYFVVALVFCQPLSIIFSMAYTESLLVALAAAVFLALQRSWWLTAGVAGLLAGLTRPTGLAAGGAIVVTVAWVLWRRWRHGVADDSGPPYTTSWWRPLLASLVALVGAPLFVWYIGARTGRWDAWFKVQGAPGWSSTFDGGVGTVRALGKAMFQLNDYYHVIVGVIVIAVLTTVAVAISERVWLPLSAYGVLVIAMALTSSIPTAHVKPRLLLPAILPVVPIALALARARTRTAVIVTVGFAAVGLWHGSWALAVWTGSP